MKKIFNWTFGSIFRTFGRIIAYIVIGAIAVILFSGHIKTPKISNILNDILFMKVDALSLDGINDGEIQIANGEHLIFIDAEFPDDSWNIIDFNSGNEDYLIIPLNGFESYNNNVYMANNTDENIQDIWKTFIKIYIFTSDNSGNQACEFQNNLLVCPLIHNKTYTRIETHFIDNDPGGSSSNYFDIRLNYHNYGILYKKDNLGSTITNVISEQTNQTIENQNQNAQSIISNQESLTNQTIQNQNQNTQQQIESQQVCKFIDKQYIETRGYLVQNGQILDGNWGVTNYINILGTEITILDNLGEGAYYCFYNTNKQLIGNCYSYQNINSNEKLQIPNNAEYARFSIRPNTNKPQFNICQNGNQAMANAITDESGPSNISSLSNDNMVGWLPPGPVDSLINLPLVLLNSLQNALSSTCSPITLTLPFVNQDIYLPCMSSLYEEMGVSSFVNWAGIVASAFILFSYLMRFYKWVDNTLTFRENNWLDNWGGE